MKERGKAEETVSHNFLSDKFNFYEPEITSCKKHPSRSSSTGICAYCLRDRLVKLVCSDCGEQRLSSCSCSDISSSYRNSCSTMEVGSVGRISFLIENEKVDLQNHHQHLNSKRRGEKTGEAAIMLRRSSSSCVEVKKNRWFWSIERLFRKKRNKGSEKNGEFCDEKSEIWLSDIVARSRSLCSLRGGKSLSFLDEGSDLGPSSAKISDVTSGIFLDHENKCDLFSGLDFRGTTKREFAQIPSDPDRVHSIQTCSVFPVKESEFSGMDESAFIDLKLDSLPEPKPETCGIRVNARGSGSRVWKWIFKYHNSIKNKGGRKMV
ncbi:hypothetical protein F511_30016 [Dorcoceras hygrometricum]|uniref:Cyclic nucleotide-binding domain-containing protein n=1 Tax=Dorcoceras hygrometricum TaxID=472368 RepID=A0A2Z7BJM0_9LAMI|nr:hypothetical protein F511_30016 [Dorcoceras hygrometricum]